MLVITIVAQRQPNPSRQHSDLPGQSPVSRSHLPGLGCRDRGHCSPARRPDHLTLTIFPSRTSTLAYQRWGSG
jgi:hypothetical protein